MAAPIDVRKRIRSTLFLELIVGVTGIGLVVFILLHLAGNLLILGGPDAFNAYAEKLQGLGAGLWIGRIGLIVFFVAHIVTAAYLARKNRRARKTRYEEMHYVSQRTFATRSMLITGTIIFLLLLLHLYDFTFGEKTGEGTIVKGLGTDELSLYGLVWNTFASPIHSLIYLIFVAAVGIHLTHATSSVFVTLGILSDKATPKVEWGARILGAVVAIGFAIIPLYVLVKVYVVGV